jgi:hypothetical protein
MANEVRLTKEDEAMLAGPLKGLVTREQFVTARLEEIRERDRLNRPPVADLAGLTADDKEALRRMPNVSREQLIEARRQEAVRACAR